MNIYLVSQDEIGGYNTYDSFVCVAKDEDEARRMHPGEIPQSVDENGVLHPDMDSWCADAWVSNINSVKAELVGVADDSYKVSKVLCASYHAG